MILVIANVELKNLNLLELEETLGITWLIFFTFQTSENFPATFVIDFHFKSITIRKYDLYNLYYFTFINMYFVSQHAVYLGKCTM